MEVTLPLILTRLAVVALLLTPAACHTDGGPGTTGTPPPPASDTTAPTVLSTRPLADATGVALNTALLLTFSEAMDTAGTAAALTVTYPDGGGGTLPVAGTTAWSTDGCVLTFQPPAGWLAETTYTVSVATSALDRAGNPLAAELLLSFTTGVLVDTTAPRVTYARPPDGATGQALNLPVVLGFSEPMDTVAVESAFALTLDAAPVSGALTWSGSGQVLTFTPASALAAGATYAVTLGTAAQDLAGNALAAPFAAAFATGSGTATTTPVADGITGTDLDGDGTVDEYTLDLTVLTPADLQDVLDDPTFDGTIVLTSEPPVEFEVPLYVNRDGVQIQVLPAGAVTLDGQTAIDTIVHVGGDNVVIDGLTVTGGLQDLITQSVDEYGVPIPVIGLVLRNLTVTGSAQDDCIQLKDCEDCLVEHVTAYNCYSHGISSTGGRNITVRNVTLGCTDAPDCIYGAYSNMGFLHFFKTDGVTVADVEITESVRRPGGSGGAYAVKVEQCYGQVLLERVHVHDTFPAVPPEGLDDGGPGDAVLGFTAHQTAAPDGGLTLRDATFHDNGAPALHFTSTPGTAPDILVEALNTTGNSGLVITDGGTDCVIRDSTIAETGVTDVAPCTGTGNTFAP